MERCQCLMVHRNCTEYRTTYLDPGRLLCNLPISSVRLTVIRGLGAAVGGYAEETPMVGWMAWMVSDVDGFSWVFVGFGSLVVAWGSWSPDALRNKGKSEMERGSERERERAVFPVVDQLPAPLPCSIQPPSAKSNPQDWQALSMLPTQSLRETLLFSASMPGGG